MTEEETAFRKRLAELPQMTNREAFETVIDAADLFITLMEEKKGNYNHEALTQAINIVEDYKNDLIRS